MHRRTLSLVALTLGLQWGCSISEGVPEPDGGADDYDGSARADTGVGSDADAPGDAGADDHDGSARADTGVGSDAEAPGDAGADDASGRSDAAGSDGLDGGVADATDVIGEGPDADGDGLSDAAELELGTRPDLADTDGDGLSDGEEVRRGTDPKDADSDDDGFTDGEEDLLGTDPNSDAAEGCAAQEAASAARTRPVDVIVIVDNSSSMDGEISAIQDRINEDFGDILDAQGVDWRVILLSRHGAIGHDVNSCDDNGICIYGDLAGTTSCDPDAAPAETDRFKQYSICINSRDGLAKTAASFDMSPPGWAGSFQQSAYFDQNEARQDLTSAPTGWHAWLRSGALRTFLMITDDESDESHDDFESWLYSKDPSYFGTAEDPNWVFHSIIAIKAKPTPTEPWLSSEDVVNENCGQGSQAIGYDYQDLSIGSGGLRFPICENGNFDSVFEAIANKVVESSTVPCTLVPEPVSGAGASDYSRTQVVYEAGDGMRTQLARISSATACDGGDYYVSAENAIELCPAMCTVVEADDAALVRLRVACLPVCGNGVLETGEECDDGNTDGGDTCSPTCEQVNLCGNGTLDPGEECDDDNVESGDGCSAGCGVEDGCGDGELGSAEECDDDNLDDGDGCSASCEVEVGCGDGKVQAGEECDDDNLDDGDGCDAMCRYEVVVPI